MKMYGEIKDKKKPEYISEKEKSQDSEIPKFIRGPTDYKIGQFRNIREGPDEPREVLNKIKMPEEDGERRPVEYERTLESQNAKLFVGKVSEDQKVLLSTRKNDNTGHTNTYKHSNIEMQRTSSYFRSRYTTFADNIDEAFCHFISESDPTGDFMNYLERASSVSETEDIKTIFPFLGNSEAIQELNALYSERAQIKSNLENTSLNTIREATARINNQIDRLRQQIYDNQFKKAQFKKRLEHLFESNQDQVNLTDEEKSDYWLWVWLKKLLNYLEEEEVIDVSKAQ